MSARRTPKVLAYAIAAWVVYSLLALVMAIVMWEGPSPAPPGTPDWVVWLCVFPHVVNGVAILLALVHQVSKDLQRTP